MDPVKSLYVVFAILAVAALWVGIAVYRYARRRIERAERLRKAGWIMIDFNFITGPVMIPPPGAKLGEEVEL